MGKGWMRMGIVMQRRRKRQAAQLRKRLLIAMAIMGAIAALALSPQIQGELAGWAKNIQTFSPQSVQQEITLPEYDVYALQLAVFDSGERAASELERLQRLGVRCVIWQRERMRIVADTAFSRDALNVNAAKEQEAYVIRDTLKAVSLRLSADALSVAEAKVLFELPDKTLRSIIEDVQMPLDQIAEDVRAAAQQALPTHPENELYTQLAQSLVSWSALMKSALEESDEKEVRSYGAVSMCLICRQLRQALSALSTASAQRTPSTAADVMPPA